MTRVTRIAVAGAGLIGREHIQRILTTGHAALAAIIDPAPSAREQAQALSVPHFADLAEALEVSRPDGVIIASPNRLHVAQGLVAVGHGIPALVEKPVADDLGEARLLVEASAKAGVPVLVGHHRRYSRHISGAKQIIADGQLGRIVSVNALTWLRKPDTGYFDGAGSWRSAPGGGVMLINLIHVIDDLRNLCGDVIAVQAATANAVRGFPVEDTAALILHFANGALGTITISDCAASPWSWEMASGESDWFPHSNENCYMIGGTDASLTLPRLELWSHRGAPNWMRPLDVRRGFDAPRDPLTEQMRHFRAVILGEETPRMTVAEGTRTLETLLAAKEAAQSGGVVRLS